MHVEPDFSPFTAEDDGRRIVLHRDDTGSSERLGLYWLMLLALGLLALTLSALWHRWHEVLEFGEEFLKFFFYLPVVLWLNVWIASHLRQEGIKRVEYGPAGVDIVHRGFLFFGRRVKVRGVIALEARLLHLGTKYQQVRRINLAARTAEGRTDLGYLSFDVIDTPEDDLPVTAAAALLAARLGVPIEWIGARPRTA